MDITLSVLDLSPITAGSTASQALRNTLDLARLADRLGYTRYWLAEHHNLPGLACSAPEIMIGQVASVTSGIRVGAGGIMLPNHSPLKVVEWFRVLEALHPERIDLGIGRAPGTDPITAIAIRRSTEALGADDFPALLKEVLTFSGPGFPPDHPFHPVHAIPVDVKLPPIWLLGSSGYSAKAAATIGTGFAFAAHFSTIDPAPPMLSYREGFNPSETFAKPHAIIAVSVVCAETEEQAEELASSLDLSYLRRQRGQPGPLPSPEEARSYPYSATEREELKGYRRTQIVGTPQAVRERLIELVERTSADEVMVTSAIYDHAARLRSYELLAAEFQIPGRTPAETMVS